MFTKFEIFVGFRYLKAKQKNGKVVIVAAMRKLLLIFGVLRTGEAFKIAA